ncbi:hypothetical protein NPX13_g10964 [Xylaria arbuscula]|uniref:Uncharacterized protein n=1 Tax=Xylaria arbuscula TaxID=114810 RepID=A0A9W8N3N5_9PEZI|nr:hypothetical protein NPX13_g10964 [Xylaria arbuscula]
MTRIVTDFYPTRLLCKRFNVRPPAHVQPDVEAETSTTKSASMTSSAGTGVFSEGAVTLDELMRQAQAAANLDNNISNGNNNNNNNNNNKGGQNIVAATSNRPDTVPAQAPVVVDADVNDALEGKRAQEEVLKAIFGDSSDEDED